MFNFLENLRKKPSFVRRQIALVISGAFSFLVFSMWVGSWGAEYASISPKTDNAKPPTEMLFSTFYGMKEGGMETWQETMALIKEATPEELTASVGNAGSEVATDNGDTPPTALEENTESVIPEADPMMQEPDAVINEVQ